jgi:hypothetical protein
MRNPYPVFLFLLNFCPLILSAQTHFHIVNSYHRTKAGRQLMTAQSSGFGLWENNAAFIGGGLNYEFGGAFPLLNINRRFYLLADTYGRISAIKKTAFGIGGTVAGEIRFYNAPEPVADFGVEISWGVNAMIYSFGRDDGIHLLYGSNWMRAGFIRNEGAGSKGGDFQYFAQFQYWRGNWYSSVGIEMDTFSKIKRKKRYKW